MNHMIHNLTPKATEVYITYDIDFIPAGTPAGRGRQGPPDGLDRRGGPARSTPSSTSTRARAAATAATPTPTRPGELERSPATPGPSRRTACSSAPAGHLHPGGLWTELKLTRDGKTVRLFRSKAKYFEPAGAVSWDVAMTATPEDWRVGVSRATCCRSRRPTTPSAPPGTSRWGSCRAAFNPGGAGPDPFATNVDVPGKVTHGHLRENRNHGGAFGGLPDARRLLAARPPPSARVPISGFVYGRGDLGMTAGKGRPPTIRPGPDAELRQPRRQAQHLPHDHELQGPPQRRDGDRLPARQRAGAVRLGQPRLPGRGPHRGRPADHLAARRRRIKAGTYTYFCRVHPFMRGAFRVAKRR